MFKFQSRNSLIAVLICSFLLTASAKAEWSQKGAHLDLWSQNTSQLDTIMSEMTERGVNHVSLAIWWWQDNINSTVVYPGKTSIESANDVTVLTAIRTAHDKGLKVMIKLIVGPKAGGSCADIPGSEAWFNGPNGYGDYVRHFAAMAQQENVELMCIGTELLGTHNKEANWRNLIASVRAMYSGELTYSQNADQNVHLLSTINWWDALDYVGLEAYYYVSQRNPTWQQMRDAWVNWISAIKARRNLIAPNMRIIFTEGGCLSMDGAASGDQYSASAAIDEQEQADWYKGMFEACWNGNEDWLVGAYFYDWQMHSYFIDPKGWEIQGKLAYDVLSSYYTSGADRNGDGRINFKDLALFAANWTGSYEIQSTVPNFGFETAGPANWTPSSQYCNYVTSGGNPDSYVSMTVSTGGPIYTWTSAAIPVTELTTYTFGLDYKAESGSSWADIVFYAANGDWAGKYELMDQRLWGYPSLNSVSNWTTKRATITSPQYCTYAIVTLYNGYATSCFDNIVLVQGVPNAPAEPAFGSNQFPNSSFENADPVWQLPQDAEFWTGNAVRSSAAAHTGTWSIKAETDNSPSSDVTCGTAYGVDFGPGIAGRDFIIEAYFMSSSLQPLKGNQQAVMKMGFFEENGNWIRDDYKYGCFSAADPVNTWKKNFIQANAPANAATVKADIYIVTPGGTVNGGPIYIDDVTLRMKTPEMTVTKASNGGFETADVYDANAKSWKHNLEGTVQRVNETAHSGNWSVKMSARAPLPGENDVWLVLSQDQYMGYDFGGKPWEFTAWLKSLSSSPITVFQDVLVKVNFIDAKGQDIRYASRTVFTAGDALDSWKPVSVTGIAPDGAIAARIEVLVKGPSDAGDSGTLYVDDVSFVTTKSLIFGDFNKDTDIDFDDLAKIVDNWLKLL